MKEKDKKALHDQIVKEVKQDFEERRQKRRPVELAWRLNMNFLMGNQYASITPTTTAGSITGRNGKFTTISRLSSKPDLQN